MRQAWTARDFQMTGASRTAKLLPQRYVDLTSIEQTYRRSLLGGMSPVCKRLPIPYMPIHVEA